MNNIKTETEHKNCQNETNGEKIALIDRNSQNNSCETNNMKLANVSVEKMTEIFNCMFDSRFKKGKFLITDGFIKVASDKKECKKCEKCKNDNSCNTFYYKDYQTFITYCCEKIKFRFFLCEKNLNSETDTKKKSKKVETAGLVLLCLLFVFFIIVVSICFYRRYKTKDNSNIVS